MSPSHDTARYPVRAERRFDPPLAACPACGARDLAPFDRDHTGVEIAACRACGLYFMNPQYSDADLADYYGSGEYIGCEDFEAFAATERAAEMRASVAKVHAVAPGGRLLSIGSGSGYELVAARELGYEVEGFDVDEGVAEHIRARLGVPFHSGDFFAAPLEPGRYRVVYMDQVLEHLKEPRRVLERVRTLLEPGGVLYLGLPNVGGLSNRWKTLVGRLGLKRKRGKHYDCYHHVSYWRPRVAEHVLTRCLDFETVALEGEPELDANPLSAALERRLCTGSTFVGIFRRPRG